MSLFQDNLPLDSVALQHRSLGKAFPLKSATNAATTKGLKSVCTKGGSSSRMLSVQTKVIILLLPYENWPFLGTISVVGVHCVIQGRERDSHI